MILWPNPNNCYRSMTASISSTHHHTLSRLVLALACISICERACNHWHCPTLPSLNLSGKSDFKGSYKPPSLSEGCWRTLWLQDVQLVSGAWIIEAEEAASLRHQGITKLSLANWLTPCSLSMRSGTADVQSALSWGHREFHAWGLKMRLCRRSSWYVSLSMNCVCRGERFAALWVVDSVD